MKRSSSCRNRNRGVHFALISSTISVFAIATGIAGCGELQAEPQRPQQAFSYCSVSTIVKDLEEEVPALDDALNGPPQPGFAENCVDCHQAGSASGRGELWGIADSTWSVAVATLLSHEADKGPISNTVERHISEVGTEHSLTGDALCDVRAFMQGFFDEGGYACERCEAAQVAVYDEYVATNMFTLMSQCTSCHGGANADPNGYGGIFLYEPWSAPDPNAPELSEEEIAEQERLDREERAARLGATVWGSPVNSAPGWFNALTRLTTRSYERATAATPAGESVEFDVSTFSLIQHLNVVDRDNPYYLHHGQPEWIDRATYFTEAFETVWQECLVAPPDNVDLTPKPGCEPACEPYETSPNLSCAAYMPLDPIARGGLWTSEIVSAFTGPACASCHVNQALGGVQWPAAANAGDLEFALAPFMVQPVANTPVLPHQTALGFKVLAPAPSDPNHFTAFQEAGMDCAELGTATEQLIDGYANGECAGGTEPEPEPDVPPVGCDEAFSLQMWNDSDLGGAETFPAACAGCHSGTPNQPGDYGAWGTTTGDWFDAAQCSVSRTSGGGAGEASATKLYQAIAGTLVPLNPHPGAPGKLDAVSTWIAYRLENCSDFVCPAP